MFTEPWVRTLRFDLAPHEAFVGYVRNSSKWVAELVPVKRLTRARGPRPAGVLAMLARLSADYVGLGSN